MNNEEIRKIVSANIKAVREHLGLTKRQLADKVGVSYKQVNVWESAKAIPSAEKLSELCKLANLPLFALYMKNMVEEFYDE